MDPTLFLASRPSTDGHTAQDIDAFYDSHGWDAFATLRHLRTLLTSLGAPSRNARRLAQLNPAE